jgi:integrase
MMWLGAIEGLRWAECAGLTVGDLDMLGWRLRVTRQLDRGRKLAPLKTEAGRRHLALPSWLVDELAAALARRGLTGADHDALVFVSPEGLPLHYQNWLRRTWYTACTKAGLPGLRFHDLRSLSATALVAAGVDPKTAQVRLGHSSSRITLDLYARVTAAGDRRAADAVAAALRPDSTRRVHAEAGKPIGF